MLSSGSCLQILQFGTCTLRLGILQFQRQAGSPVSVQVSVLDKPVSVCAISIAQVDANGILSNKREKRKQPIRAAQLLLSANKPRRKPTGRRSLLLEIPVLCTLLTGPSSTCSLALKQFEKLYSPKVSTVDVPKACKVAFPQNLKHLFRQLFVQGAFFVNII